MMIESLPFHFYRFQYTFLIYSEPFLYQIGTPFKRESQTVLPEEKGTEACSCPIRMIFSALEWQKIKAAWFLRKPSGFYLPIFFAAKIRLKISPDRFPFPAADLLAHLTGMIFSADRMYKNRQSSLIPVKKPPLSDIKNPCKSRGLPIFRRTKEQAKKAPFLPIGRLSPAAGQTKLSFSSYFYCG